MMSAEACATIGVMTEETVESTVLVVEDEEPILFGLVELFRAQGFKPTGVADGQAAVEKLASEQYDLVILDLMIPKIPGLDVLRQTRSEGNMVPVLVLTALGAESDVVAGLEAGADDYVTKPFGIRELVARATGLLRRASIKPEVQQAIQIGDVSLDTSLLSVNWRGDDGSRQELALTSREGLILQYLLSRRHRPVSRAELLVDVWGYRDGSMQTRTVDVHIGQLRGKLAGIPGGEQWIETVRGRGYRFAVDVG